MKIDIPTLFARYDSSKHVDSSIYPSFTVAGNMSRFAFILLALLLFSACGNHKVSDNEHIQRAKQYQSKGDIKASLIELKNALQQNPKNSEARLLLGELYDEVGNGEAAEKELINAQQLGVSGPYLQKLLGRALLLQHRYADVLSTLEKIDVISQPELLVLLGKARYGMGNSVQARAAYNQALVLQPDDSAALLGLAALDIDAGDKRSAQDKVTKVLAHDKNHAEAWLMQGDLATQEDHRNAAREAYQKAIELATTSVPTRTALTARSGLTKLLITEGKYKEAKTQVDYLLMASPQHPHPNYLAALLSFEQKRYAESRDYLQKVMKTFPDHLPSLYLLGSVNYALGNFEQAELQLARVISERPALLPARMLLASIRLRQAQADQALDILEPALEKNPDDIRLLAMAGQAALRSGDLERGKRYLQGAVANQPSASGLRGQLATLYLAEGNEEQAIKELEQAVAEGNAPQREQVLLALTYARKRDFDKALEIAGKLATENPKDAYPLNLLGVLLTEKGDVSLARKSFVQALSLDEAFTPATLNLARLDTLSGRPTDARRRIEGILARDERNISAMMALAQLADADNDREQALKWLEQARKVDDKALAPRLLLARYYYRIGDLSKAGETIKEAVSINSTNSAILDLQGEIQIASKDYSAAVQTYEELIKHEPSAKFYYRRGVALFRNGKKDAARASLERALKISPDNLQTASLLIVMDVEASRFDDAMRMAAEVKRRHPGLPAGYELEGDIRTQQKQFQAAAGAFREARKLKNSNQLLLKEAAALRRSQGDNAANQALVAWLQKHDDDTLVRFSLAVAYSRVKGGERAAIAEYRKVLDKTPENADALNNLAWLLQKDRQTNDALRMAEKAYELRPDSGSILDTLGWIKLQQGELKASLGLLRQAADKSPESGNVQYHLATALAKSGKKGEARKVLEKLLRADNEFTERNNAKALLQTL